MSKITVKGDKQYSLKPFEGYKFRAKFVYSTKIGNQLFNTDIYTDNTSREVVEAMLMAAAKKKYPHVVPSSYSGVIVWISKEQDDRVTTLLDEILDGI